MRRTIRRTKVYNRDRGVKTVRREGVCPGGSSTKVLNVGSEAPQVAWRGFQWVPRKMGNIFLNNFTKGLPNESLYKSDHSDLRQAF